MILRRRWPFVLRVVLALAFAEHAIGGLAAYAVVAWEVPLCASSPSELRRLAISPAIAQQPPAVYAVTTDAVLKIDPETGAVLRRISVGPLFGRLTITGDSNGLFIIEGAGQTVVAVNPDTGDTKSFSAQCCLTGSAAAVQDRLYLMSEEFSESVLTTYAGRTGQGLRQIVLPSDVRAVTVVGPQVSTSGGCFGDYNRDGDVTVDEILRVVANALGGCPNE